MIHGRRVAASLLAIGVLLGVSGCGCATESPEAPPPKQDVDTPPAQSQTRACMPKPSACGFPDGTNTGVSTGTPLERKDGVVTLDEEGQVFENKLVNGSIVVTAPNVTIRNVKLVVDDPYFGISAKNGGDWDNDQANLLVDHVEIDMNGNIGLKGIAFNGYTLQRSYIHDGADCAHFSSNVTIEDSFCVVGPDADGDGWPDSKAFCDTLEHLDGIQTNGAANAVIRHNTVRNPCSQTSDVALFGSVRNITIDDNLLAGGGYSLYCGSPTATKVVVSNNRFARTWHPRSGRWGRMAHCDTGIALSGNKWDERE